MLTSMEFLKALLELAKDVVQVEKETVPEIVERIVNDIDGIVRIVRFPG